MTQTSSSSSKGANSFGEGILEIDTAALMRELPNHPPAVPEPPAPEPEPEPDLEAEPVASIPPEDNILLHLFGDDSARPAGQVLVKKFDQLILALVALVLVALFFILYFASAVFFPILLACMLNLLLSPVVRWLKKAGVPHSIGAALVLSGGLLVMGLGIYYLSEPASEWLARAPGSAEQLKTRFRGVTESVDQLTKTSEQVMAATQGELSGDPEEDLVASLSEPMKVQVVAPPMTGTELLNMTGSFASTALATVILLYFLLAAGDRFLDKGVQLMPTYEEKWKIVEIVRNIERGISSYLLSVTLINICLGLAIGLLLWAVGMPNPFLWGAMATLLNYIPYLGAIAGVIIVTVVALLEPGHGAGWWLLPPVIYATCTTIEGNFLTPMILGYRLNLNPVVIFVWLLFWGWMWGIPGAILAVPILAAFKILCDHIKLLKPIGTFLVQ